MLVALLAAAGVMGVTAAVSKRQDRVAVVDVAWGSSFVAIAIVLALVWPDGHSWLLALLVTIWGGRLAWHIARRSHGAGEDPRYEKMLGGPGWHAGAAKVVVRVFLTQAVVAFIISAPLQAAAIADVQWWPVVWLGVLVWAVGLFFEVVGDRQLAAYKAKPRESRPKILDTGLWGWTRHPNYFGDACVWWGLWIAGAVSLGWVPGLVTVFAPIAMTFFIRNVTGAKLLEQTMSQREGWSEYADRVPLFFPRPPRR
ncbi:Steroid 5-alpha reductase family enzyme [Nocardioides exalbidus]|uniref:Steroid 5-alpha reductase family enzyme n=1 Tax=Nocardioides exalbidus TaxID=402596 RepID=A0A1H4MX46_9ACTN|nr:Steroid 5-alpha reductase family enzyme [Nocardioides exalbidus]